jgi:hypothetical protein
MDKELKDMSIEELKVLGYDQIMLLEQTKNNLAIIQQEIQKRLEIKKEI